MESMIFPPDSKPYGLSYPEWTIRWWRWLLSLPKEKNPALDLSGVYSAHGQKDPHAWFLAGTFGGVSERKCTIPKGKAILIPIINYECSFADEPSMTADTQLESKCKSEIDDIKELFFGIDELLLRDVSSYRIRSPLFSIDLQEDNVLGVNPGRTKMISDGFWIFLKPLSIGKHQVTSLGSCRSGKIRIGATYKIDVE
jgi:hypothetical protein